ncbi:hypothetical protein HDU67_007598, partial [Dinochytrium kinnereticum]
MVSTPENDETNCMNYGFVVKKLLDQELKINERNGTLDSKTNEATSAHYMQSKEKKSAGKVTGRRDCWLPKKDDDEENASANSSKGNTRSGYGGGRGGREGRGGRVHGRGGYKK